MAENFTLADAIIEFSGGTTAEWNAFTKVIPNNVLVFTTDNMMLKQGNGSDLYSALPAGPTFAEVQAGSQEMIDALIAFNASVNDSIIFINGTKYDVSTTTIQSIIDRITAISSDDDTQDTYLDSVDSQNQAVDLTVTGADDDKMAIISAGKITPGTTVESMGGVVVTESLLHIQGVQLFTDEMCINKVSEMSGSSVYYCEVDGFHDNLNNEDLTYSLVSGSSEIVVEATGGRGFKLTTAPLLAEVAVNLTVTVDDGVDTSSIISTVTVGPSRILVSVYGGTGADVFYGINTDSNDNIICVGTTTSEGQGGDDALVVKFDSSLAILVAKIYGGTGDDHFYGVTIDSADNIICVGATISEGQGGGDTLVVKFDSSLTTSVAKIYGGTGYEVFRSVITDSNDNIICVGYTYSEGQGSADALVVKFDSSLTILARKIYGGIGDEAFQNIVIDSSDNIICIGKTSSEGQGGGADALVVKFDSSLSILVAKIYGGTGNDQFRYLTIDSNDNIICVGFTDSEGQGNFDALVVKFDSSLTILAAKIYGGTGSDWFQYLAVDSSDNIICSGYTTSEGQGSYDALVVKFSSSLAILAAKIYGGTGSDVFYGINTDPNDNIICVGTTTSEGQGGDDALVVKFPNEIPSGSFVGTVLTGLTLADSALVLADSALTLANSTLTLADSTLTLANSTLTLANSTLTQEYDALG